VAASVPQLPTPVSPSARDAATPRVTFIVPLFNCLALTQAMLASLRATIPAGLTHEIILIDDGSTDGTRPWLETRTEPPFRVLMNERNLGFAATNNRAAAVARGEWLVLLNNDLVLLPHWLEPMLATHRALGWNAGIVGNVQLDAQTGAVDHVGITFDLKAKPEHERRLPPPWTRWLTRRRRVPAVTGACMLVAKALWVELDGFDEGYHNGGEDVDLCFRARANGRINAVALHSVVRHHISSSIGRKLRDEANSQRLARTWRREFAECAARKWCRAYLAAVLPRPADYDPMLVARITLHAAGLSPRPPPEAIAALEASLELEFARWDRIVRP
jgi:O-antigen biosynthesis protein